MNDNRDERPDVMVKLKDGSLYVIQAKEFPEMSYEETLRKAIVESGLTQYHIAKLTGLAQGGLSKFLNGGSLQLDTFNRLSHLMGFEFRQNRKRVPKRRRSTTK